MPIKKNDFIEIEYTGRLKEGNIVFDTTDAKIANEHHIASQTAVYGPIIICVGEGHVVKGLDKFLEGKDLGKFIVDLAPEDAFGKKDVKLIAMIPSKKFIEQKVQPMPGLQVNVDGMSGIIRTVAGGRIIVDFNHPLSGKAVVYEIKINRVVVDKKEKAEALAKLMFGKGVKVAFDGETAKIETLHEIPLPISNDLKKKFKDIAEVNLEFVKIDSKTEKQKNPVASKEQ